MRLKDKTVKELQEIIRKDYGQKLSEEQASELGIGISLLKLTRLALAALARKNKKEK